MLDKNGGDALQNKKSLGEATAEVKRELANEKTNEFFRNPPDAFLDAKKEDFKNQISDTDAVRYLKKNDIAGLNKLIGGQFKGKSAIRGMGVARIMVALEKCKDTGKAAALIESAKNDLAEQQAVEFFNNPPEDEKLAKQQEIFESLDSDEVLKSLKDKFEKDPLVKKKGKRFKKGPYIPHNAVTRSKAREMVRDQLSTELKKDVSLISDKEVETRLNRDYQRVTPSEAMFGVAKSAVNTDPATLGVGFSIDSGRTRQSKAPKQELEPTGRETQRILDRQSLEPASDKAGNSASFQKATGHAGVIPKAGNGACAIDSALAAVSQGTVDATGKYDQNDSGVEAIATGHGSAVGDNIFDGASNGRDYKKRTELTRDLSTDHIANSCGDCTESEYGSQKAHKHSHKGHTHTHKSHT